MSTNRYIKALNCWASNSTQNNTQMLQITRTTGHTMHPTLAPKMPENTLTITMASSIDPTAYTDDFMNLAEMQREAQVQRTNASSPGAPPSPLHLELDLQNTPLDLEKSTNRLYRDVDKNAIRKFAKSNIS